MNKGIDRRTGRQTRELPKLHHLEARGEDGKQHLFVGELYTETGPGTGTGCLAWKLAGPGYEMIEVPPKTDAIIQFSDGDFARIRLENPEAVRGETHDERLANQDELTWSLTNVGMQVGGQGIEVPKDAILSSELKIGEHLVLASEKWPSALKSNGVVESVFVYDRRRPESESVAKGKPETSILEDFRSAVKRRAAQQAIRGSGVQKP